MKLPSKVTSYKESILSKTPILINVLINKNEKPYDLYLQTKDHFADVNEFIDVLDCLFALKVISFNELEEKIYYVM